MTDLINELPGISRKRDNFIVPITLCMPSFKSLDVLEFLEEARKVPVIDVRSPAEYQKGHIPGSYNIPLFDNEERAYIGTIYNQQGREEAVKKGLEFVSPKMTGYIEKAFGVSGLHELLIYCWRGGMRSESMAWLLSLAGIQAMVLRGGYKSYRNHILNTFADDRQLIVLGGMTGSGKTQILQAIKQGGHQVVDLEGLASHKGSVFGDLGLKEQPSNQQFENDLGRIIMGIKPDYPAWLEDESLNIGKVTIPKPLFTRMMASDLIRIEMDPEIRIQRIYSEYANFEREKLAELTLKISRRLGGEDTKKVLFSLHQGNIVDAIRILLRYYDKKYLHSIQKRESDQVHVVHLKTDEPERNAGIIIDLARSLKLIS